MKCWRFTPINKGKTDSEIELRIDGDIVDDEESWLYELLGIPTTCPNAFRSELKKYAGRHINVWIDSYGGNVYAATGMYNALMEHRQNGGHVTTIGDAKVMSAATIVFMAGEKRKVSPGCVFMIHNPLINDAGGYAEDLRKAADVLDTVKETILNAYEAGTGQERQFISELMDDETYMSAQTAVKNRFATEILYSHVSPINAGCGIDFDRRRFANFSRQDAARLKEILQKTKGVNGMDDKKEKKITNLTELIEQYGGLVDEAKQEAVLKERKRITDLQAADDGSKQVHEIVMHAVARGQTIDDVQFFIDTAKANAPINQENTKYDGQSFMKQVIADNANSGVNGVKGAGTSKDMEDEAERDSFITVLNNTVRGK